MRIFTVTIPKGKVISTIIVASTVSITLRMKKGGPVFHTNDIARGPASGILYAAPPIKANFELIPQGPAIGFLSQSLHNFNAVEIAEAGIARIDLYAKNGPAEVEITVI